MTDLSIIIPLYNAAEFIERCVASCADQGLGESFEIIVVDDGSTDNSLAVAERLRDKYPMLRVFSQENQGAGMARNHGLSVAQGRYVSFVDSDDYLLPGALKGIVERCVDNQLDLCKYIIRCKQMNDGSIISRKHEVETEKVFTGEYLMTQQSVAMDSACSSVYDKAFLDSNGLRFSSQTSSEDTEFTINVYAKAQRVMFTNEEVYVYEIREGTRGHSVDEAARRRYLLNNIHNAVLMKNVMATSHFSTTTRRALRKRINSMTFGILYEMLQAKGAISADTVQEVLNLAKAEGLYPIKGSTYTWKSTLMAKALNIEWVLKRSLSSPTP